MYYGFAEFLSYCNARTTWLVGPFKTANEAYNVMEKAYENGMLYHHYQQELSRYGVTIEENPEESDNLWDEVIIFSLERF